MSEYGEWIAVKDRLPEGDHFVLGCVPKRPYVLTWYSTFSERWMPIGTHVTHWMELPERPDGSQ